MRQTIAADPSDRQVQDSKNTKPDATLFQTWCDQFRGEADFDVYEFVHLEVKLNPNKGSKSTWLTRSDLWNREHLVVLGGWLGTMNSGPGGMPQVQVCPRPE